MTTTQRRPRTGDPAALRPAARQRSAAVLLAGALLAWLVVVPVGSAKLYWVPLILGLSYLLAGAVAGRSSQYWAAGLVVSGWGLAVLLVLRGTWTTDFAGTAVTGIGVGLLLATQLPRVGIAVSALSLAVPVLLIGAFELLQADSGGVFSRGWAYGAVLAVRALYDLRPER